MFLKECLKFTKTLWMCDWKNMFFIKEVQLVMMLLAMVMITIFTKFSVFCIVAYFVMKKKNVYYLVVQQIT